MDFVWIQHFWGLPLNGLLFEAVLKCLPNVVPVYVATTALDKRGYPHIIFHISAPKHMLWVLIRSISVRCF